MRTAYVIVAAFAVALSACATNPQSPGNSLARIQAALGPLKGRPVKTVVARLGPPDWIDRGDQGQVYVWDGSNARPDFWTNFSSCNIRVY